MSGAKRAVCRFAVLGLMLVFWFLAEAAAIGTEKYSEGVSVKKTKGVWSYDEAEHIWQEEQKQEFPATCTFLGERKAEHLENRELGRMETASVIEVLGDTQGFLPASAPLYKEDQESCLLSEDMAYKLFGSKNIMGEEIYYRGRVLTVRGILRGMERTAAVQAAREEDSVLDTIAYGANTEEESLENPVQTFLMRHGIQGKVQERKYLAVCAKLLVFFLPLVIFVRIAGRMAGNMRAQKVCRIRTAVLCAGMILMTVIFFILFWKPLGLTRNVMPTKWSDFLFWKQMTQQIRDNLELLLQTQKTSLDFLVLSPFFSCLKYCVMTWGLYAVRCRIQKKAGAWETAAGILFSWILLLATIRFAGDSAIWLAGQKSVWFGACFWLIGEYAAETMQVSCKIR